MKRTALRSLLPASLRVAQHIVLLGSIALGTTAYAQSPEQQPNPIRKFKDWSVQCGPVTNARNETEDRCVMAQLAGKDGKPMAQVEFTPSPKDGETLAQFTTPLGTVLTNGLRLKVDEGKASAVPFQFCLSIGCRAVYPVKAEFVATMKRGNNLILQFDLVSGQTATATLSLAGFTAALREISK